MNFARLLLLPACLALAIPFTQAAEAARPNILLILIDDLNDWIGAMNSHPNALTPNLDLLAGRGTLFTNAHAAAPLCGPTRAAMLSGLKPSTTGVYGHNNLANLHRNPVIRTRWKASSARQFATMTWMIFLKPRAVSPICQ